MIDSIYILKYLSISYDINKNLLYITNFDQSKYSSCSCSLYSAYSGYTLYHLILEDLKEIYG